MLITLLASGAALGLAACGGGGSPVEVRLKKQTAERSILGFPALATKNTTRVGGKDPIADAAAVSTAVYPGEPASQRPSAVALVEAGSWQAGVAASVLMAPPLRAPILLTDGGSMPDASSEALKTLNPKGYRGLKGVQTLRIGNAAKPSGLRTQQIGGGGDPATLAASIDRLRTKLAGSPSNNVVIVSTDSSDFSTPAAAWAAKSGDSVLFVHANELPAQTKAALRERQNPGIYVLGPARIVRDGVLRKLKRYGTVTRISGPIAPANAVAFARFSNGSFGWGVRDPGHGLVIANIDRPLDAAASAPLAASGTYGPLLLTDSATKLPVPLENFLLDIQPGYRFDPVRGVYNHAWLMGDESAISLTTQGRIDALTEITHVKGN